MEQMELLLFDDSKEEIKVTTKTDDKKKDLEDLKTELDNVRRGLFSRYSSLVKKCGEMANEIEYLKSKLSRNYPFEFIGDQGHSEEKIVHQDFASNL
jgi:hypothetical protein